MSLYKQYRYLITQYIFPITPSATCDIAVIFSIYLLIFYNNLIYHTQTFPCSPEILLDQSSNILKFVIQMIPLNRLFPLVHSLPSLILVQYSFFIAFSLNFPPFSIRKLPCSSRLSEIALYIHSQYFLISTVMILIEIVIN